MPFQKIYVINASNLIQEVQNKVNLTTYVPNLLDFGMLFSGLNRKSKATLTRAYGVHGNGFTKSVHKHLTSGSDLQAATRTAVDKLAVSIPNNFTAKRQVGLYEALRHQLTLATTGAIYGPENPYDDPAVEQSWLYVYHPPISSSHNPRYSDRPLRTVSKLCQYYRVLYSVVVTHYRPN